MSLDGFAASSKLKVQRGCAVEVDGVALGMKQLLSGQTSSFGAVECWSVQPGP